MREIAADILVISGATILTVAVLAIVRLRDVYLQVHGVSLASIGGVLVTLLAIIAAGEPPMIARAALVALFLLLTSPVSAHALARLRSVRTPREQGEEPKPDT